MIWVAPAAPLLSDANEDTPAAAQQDSVLALFRLVKAMLDNGDGERALGLSIMTQGAAALPQRQQINPAHAAVHGFAGSLAREYPDWQGRVLDLVPAAGLSDWRQIWHLAVLAQIGRAHG